MDLFNPSWSYFNFVLPSYNATTGTMTKYSTDEPISIRHWYGNQTARADTGRYTTLVILNIKNRHT